MLKKFYLWSALVLFVFGITASILSGFLAQEAKAQSDNIALWQIDDLDALNLSFTEDQNTLVLELVGDATHEVRFSLIKIESDDRIVFTYGADSQAELAYTLIGVGNDVNSTANCQVESQIIVDIGLEEDQGELYGLYEQKWENYDVHNRADILKAELTMPLGNTATANTGDCFILEEAINLDNTGYKALFSIFGQRTSDNSCDGLSIYGRGGDDLEKPGVFWSCYDNNVNPASADEGLIKLTTIDNPPFDRSYIFVENRQGEKCGGRLLVKADHLDNHYKSVTAEWQDFHDDCKNGQYNKENGYKKVRTFGLVNNTAGFLEHLQETGSPGEADRPPPEPGEGAITTSPNATLGSGATVDQTQTCAWQNDGLGVGFIICWILKGLSEAIQGIEKVVYNFLTLESSEYDEAVQLQENRGFTYKAAWRAIRDITSYAIVGTALFMIIATALNIGFFSNYTVKKYLPRLVVGTILIQFSWTLGDFLIQFTNQLGDMVSALVFSSFPDAKDHGMDDIFDGGFSTLVAGGALGSYAIVAVYLNWAIILPVVLTGFIAFVLGFMFLVARKYIIIMSLILSPLGLAFWILPGNDRAWRFYSKIFMYSLLFYPIIILIISFAKVFSYVIVLDEGNAIALIVAFLVYVGGFIAIPMAAKSFTGLLGQVTGAINDRSKGFIDRPRKSLKDLVANRGAKRKAAREEREKGAWRQNLRRWKEGGTLRNPNRKTKGERLADRWKRFAGGGTWGTPNKGKKSLKERAAELKNKSPKELAGDLKAARTKRRETKPSVSAIAGAQFQEETYKRSEAIAERELRSLTGGDSDELREIALNASTVQRGVAALKILVKQGRMEVVEEVVTEALNKNDPAKANYDKTLQEVLWRAQQTDIFYEDNVVEMAPHLANLKFNIERGQGVIDRVDYTILGNPKAIDAQKWNLSTWKTAFAQDRALAEKLAGVVLGGGSIAKLNVQPNTWEYLEKTFPKAATEAKEQAAEKEAKEKNQIEALGKTIAQHLKDNRGKGKGKRK